jgi:hypothetical protein
MLSVILESAGESIVDSSYNLNSTLNLNFPLNPGSFDVAFYAQISLHTANLKSAAFR